MSSLSITSTKTANDSAALAAIVRVKPNYLMKDFIKLQCCCKAPRNTVLCTKGRAFHRNTKVLALRLLTYFLPRCTVFMSRYDYAC